jgi:RimJ/RimL family protein N-acetyltransferase
MVKMTGVLIETERLLLRPLTVGDIDAIVAIHAEPEVVRFMGLFDRRRVTEWLSLVEQDYAEGRPGRLAVIERASGRLLGRSGLKYWPQFSETELGWVLHPEAWGHGYATEAGSGSSEWAFRNLDVRYLTAMVRPDNHRSIAVAQRIGMSPLRSDTLLGELVTVYAISRDEWTLCARQQCAGDGVRLAERGEVSPGHR